MLKKRLSFLIVIVLIISYFKLLHKYNMQTDTVHQPHHHHHENTAIAGDFTNAAVITYKGMRRE